MQLRTIAVTAVTVATLIAPTGAVYAEESTTPVTTTSSASPLTRAQILEIRREAMDLRTSTKNAARTELNAKVAAAAKVQKAALKKAASIKNEGKRLSRIAEIRETYYVTASAARAKYFETVAKARETYEATVAATVAP